MFHQYFIKYGDAVTDFGIGIVDEGDIEWGKYDLRARAKIGLIEHHT